MNLSVKDMSKLLLQPSLLGREQHLLEHVDNDESFDDDDGELMWKAPPLLSLADIPWLVDDIVEPGVTLRYVVLNT